METRRWRIAFSPEIIYVYRCSAFTFFSPAQSYGTAHLAFVAPRWRIHISCSVVLHLCTPPYLCTCWWLNFFPHFFQSLKTVPDVSLVPILLEINHPYALLAGCDVISFSLNYSFGRRERGEIVVHTLVHLSVFLRTSSFFAPSPSPHVKITGFVPGISEVFIFLRLRIIRIDS